MTETNEPVEDETEEHSFCRKTINRKNLEYQIIESDRIKLIEAANDFVFNHTNKQILPLINGIAHVEPDISIQEKRTFEAALTFLREQFERGGTQTRVYEQKDEAEESAEFV